MEWGQHASSTAWGVVLMASAVAAILDVRTGKIPNALTFPLLLCGFAWSALGVGIGALSAAGAAVMVSLPFVVLYAMGAGGAGDAKLMAGLGAWLGFVDGTVALLGVLAAGALLGLLLAAARGHLSKALSTVGHVSLSLILRLLSAPRQLPSVPSRTDGMIPMPYGVSILAGTCLAALGVFVWSQ